MGEILSAVIGGKTTHQLPAYARPEGGVKGLTGAALDAAIEGLIARYPGHAGEAN